MTYGEVMNELALFAGAGGGILGGHLLGWRTVCAVEREPYAASVLMQRQNDGILPTFPIWDDVCTFDGKPWRGLIDVVSGGFPCQDISSAGNGAGIDGERSGLWREMARIVGEVRPRFVFVENSPLLVSRGLAVVISDLAEMGYDAQWCCISASDTGAPHKRDRIWLVANSSSLRQLQPQGIEQDERGRTGNGSQKMADPSSAQDHAERGDCKRGRNAMGRHQEAAQQDHGTTDHHGISGCRGSWWGSDPADDPKSGVGRMANGVAARMDRLKAIGNGQVPRVAAAAFTMMVGEI